MNKRNIYARVTTQTLIDATRYCYAAGGTCTGCPLSATFPDCLEYDLALELADRIEALWRCDKKRADTEAENV